MTRFFHKLMRPAMALALGIGIALSPVASAPARADLEGDELLAFLIALGIIGVAIDQSGDTSVTGPYPRPNPPYPRPPQPPRPRHPDTPAHLLIPESCLVQYNFRGAKQAFVTQACLKQRFDYWRHMPRQCDHNLRFTRHGRDVRQTAYDMPCLRRHGYRLNPRQ
jgi:hypothetical protein